MNLLMSGSMRSSAPDQVEFNNLLGTLFCLYVIGSGVRMIVKALRARAEGSKKPGLVFPVIVVLMGILLLAALLKDVLK